MHAPGLLVNSSGTLISFVSSQVFEGQRDVVLFCIDCSSSMHERPKESPDEQYKSHVYTALEAVMQIQKRKVVVGPNDAVGILLFNTVRYRCLSAYYSFKVMKSVQEERKSCSRSN